VGTARLVGRTITQWSLILGSYGMGGPGFFGLHLSAADAWAAEWLVLTVWGASAWLLLDGHWVEATPDPWAIQRPLYSNYAGDASWDEVSPVITGATIMAVTIQDRASALHLQQGRDVHVLEVPDDSARLPAYAGNGQPRSWGAHESQWDAWAVSQSGDLWC
jgi:hypothetical protein